MRNQNFCPIKFWVSVSMCCPIIQLKQLTVHYTGLRSRSSQWRAGKEQYWLLGWQHTLLLIYPQHEHTPKLTAPPDRYGNKVGVCLEALEEKRALFWEQYANTYGALLLNRCQSCSANGWDRSWSRHSLSPWFPSAWSCSLWAAWGEGTVNASAHTGHYGGFGLFISSSSALIINVLNQI